MSIAIIVCSILFTGVVCFLLGSAYQYKHYKIDGSTSDGYHTFDELYYYRLLYNANMVNLIQYINDNYPGKLDIKVYKSLKHDDGNPCFGGGWFIVQMETPYGQISNHYERKYWHMFNCSQLPYAREWDGHTSDQAADRLYKLSGYITRKAGYKWKNYLTSLTCLVVPNDRLFYLMPITGIEHKYEILKQSKSNNPNCYKDAISGWINNINIRIEASKRFGNNKNENIENEENKNKKYIKIMGKDIDKALQKLINKTAQ